MKQEKKQGLFLQSSVLVKGSKELAGEPMSYRQFENGPECEERAYSTTSTTSED